MVQRWFRVEHADFLFPEHFAELREAGIVVVQNPLHFGIPDMIAARVGPARFAEAQPLRTLLDEGIPVALGTDSIGAVQSPWIEVEEHRVGTLAPGVLADLAVLSQDVFAAAPPALPGTTSVLTMVGGEVVWDAGEL